jgi:tetratricopeptide (TPR) repeat protein
MFKQRGELHHFDGEYQVSFSIEDLTQSDGFALSIELFVSLDLEERTAPKLLIQPRHAHAVEPSFLEPDKKGTYEGTLQVVAEDNETELGFIIIPWLPNSEEDINSHHETHVKLLSAKKLTICKRFFDVDADIDLWENVSTLYEDDAPYFLLNFTTETRRILDYESFVALVAELAEMDNRYASVISQSRGEFFKNMIIGDSGGKYHRITDHGDFEQKLDIYNQQKSLMSVNKDPAIKLSLRDLEREGRFEELYQVLDRIEIVEKRPWLLFDHQLEFYLAKSQIEGENLPMSAITELAIDSDVVEYEKAMEKAKIGGDSFDETAELWRNLIGPTIEHSYESLPFVLGRYLHWKTRTYTQRDENLEIAPILNHGASELSMSVDDWKYTQLSKYNQHLRAGFQFLSSGYLAGAEDEFDKALAVAANEDDSWYEKRPDLMVTPLRYKTLAEVSGGPIEYEYDDDKSFYIDTNDVESEELMKKLSLVGERIELLQTVFQDTTISVERAINNLRAKQYRLLANQRISTQHYELAIEAINEVIRIYAELGDKSERDRAIGFREHISAVLAETRASFDEAADSYAEVANSPEYASNDQQRRYHEIRSKICSAKSCLLRGDLDDASDIIKEITESVSEVKYEAANLSLLLDVLRDFEEEERSSIDKVLGQVAEFDDQERWDLSISFDYKPAITAIVSAQRLRIRGVDTELLRRFIRVGIAASFTPDNSEEVVSDTGLSDISVDSMWRNYLPIYTHKSLERIEIKENNVPTGDYSDVAGKLFSTFEKYLEIIVEFYGEVCGGEWKKAITDDPDKDLTLGDLAQFFQSENVPDVPLESMNDIKQAFNNSIINNMSLVKVRNELNHGHIDDLSEDEYVEIKAAIVAILEDTAPEAPIIFQPKSRNNFGSSTIYSCELFWSEPQKQASIETSGDLDTNDVYFMAPECRSSLGQRDIVEIEGEKIVRAKERRVNEAVGQ